MRFRRKKATQCNSTFFFLFLSLNLLSVVYGNVTSFSLEHQFIFCFIWKTILPTKNEQSFELVGGMMYVSFCFCSVWLSHLRVLQQFVFLSMIFGPHALLHICLCSSVIVDTDETPEYLRERDLTPGWAVTLNLLYLHGNLSLPKCVHQ